MKEYLIAVVFFAVFCLAIVTIRQQTEGLRTGYQIGQLHQKLERLRDSNDRLRLAVLKLRSPANIMEGARRLELQSPRAEQWNVVTAPRDSTAPETLVARSAPGRRDPVQGSRSERSQGGAR